MSQEFERVHLLTFKHMGHMGIENSHRSFKVLNDRVPGKFKHTFVDVSDMFSRLYRHRYIQNLIKYRTLQMQFTCFACQACFHVNTIIYCLKNNIRDVRDGANTEYEEASPMQIKIVKNEIEKLYRSYDISHESPVYEEHSRNRSDSQLFELGLRPASNIKDNEAMYKAYQGYCKYMPGSVLFLNYWKRSKDYPEKVQSKMLHHWLEEVDFMKQIIDEHLDLLK